MCSLLTLPHQALCVISPPTHRRERLSWCPLGIQHWGGLLPLPCATPIMSNRELALGLNQKRVRDEEDKGRPRSPTPGHSPALGSSHLQGQVIRTKVRPQGRIRVEGSGVTTALPPSFYTGVAHGYTMLMETRWRRFQCIFI